MRAKAKAEKIAAEKKATFGQLLSGYVDDLKHRGAIRWRDTESFLKPNIIIPWPALLLKPAAEITLDDLLDIIRVIIHSGRIREAAKVRTYLRAAYSAAVQACQRVEASPSLVELKLRVNPACDFATIAGTNQSHERILSLGELQA